MHKLIIGTLTALLAAACTSSPGPQQARFNDVTFDCTRGETLSVRFHLDDERAVLTRNGQSIELRQQPSGSGFRYSNGPNTIYGKGDALTVEIGRMVPLQCTARPAPAAVPHGSAPR